MLYSMQCNMLCTGKVLGILASKVMAIQTKRVAASHQPAIVELKLARLCHHARGALRASVGGKHKCQPRLRHQARRARHDTVGRTRKCPPLLRHNVRRALCAFASGTCVRLVSAIIGREHYALLAAHARVRLVFATMCGERCAHLRAAYACAALVSATMR